MKKEEQGIKRTKIGFAIGAGIIALLFVVLTVIVVLPRESDSKDSGAGEEVSGFAAIFRNRYQVTQLYGNSGSAEVLSQMEKVVFDEDEIQSAPQENNSPDEFDKHYEVTIAETSVRKYTEYPLVYTLHVAVSDGREYDVYARSDTEYDADSDKRSARISTVMVRNDLKYFNTNATNDNLLNVLNDWFKTF